MAIRVPSLRRFGDPQFRRVLRYVVYPVFYVSLLVVFVFWTFPYERLKERVIAEFNARQPAGAGVRMEIDDMSSYWLSGLEAEGVRLISPPGSPGEDGKPAPEKVVTIDEAHARVALLSWLFGSTKLSFGADAFGGGLSGTSSRSDESEQFHLELDDVAVGQLPMLSQLVELPIGGTLSGTVDFELPGGKFSKADGRIELKATDLSVGDGKAKIKGTIALPKAEGGELEIVAEVSEGRLKFEKLAMDGKDLQFDAEGQIRLRDPFDASVFDMSLRFKFSDAYRNKDDMTRSLLGAPGSSMPALLEMDPKVKRSKRPDGFYGFRVSGPMSRPTFTPSATGGGDAGAGRSGARTRQ
jgi:type II secretion system protein N